MSMIETWRPIAGYEGFYSISSIGRVRSEYRVISHGAKTQTVRTKIMSPARKKSGHLSVMLHGKSVKRMHVHRLVALAFIGDPPSPLHEVAGIIKTKLRTEPTTAASAILYAQYPTMLLGSFANLATSLQI